MPPAPQGMMLLECLDLSIVDHHNRQVLKPLTDPVVFDTVSDVLEIGFWIATEMPEQVPKDEGRDDTQLGPSELTRAHLLELARQLKELTSKYSPFGERFGGRANSQWGAAVSAIVEFQSVYEIVSVDGPVRMDPSRLRRAVALAVLRGAP